MTGAARETLEPVPLEPAPGSNSSEPTHPTRKKGRRGFASMDPEKQRAIASLGGKAAHERGTAHEFTSEKAREAGRLGGLAAEQRRAERRRADR